VLYRPVEQLLSRTISDRDVRGHEGHEHLRVAITIQLVLGLVFAAAALAFHHLLKDKLLSGSTTLYWVLIGAVLGYAASYFARGFLAGHRRFGLYGGLVFMEAISRFMFALVVAVGIFSGQSVVALGMVAAPLCSLSVVPWAVRRSLKRTDPARRSDDALTAAELDAASAGEPGTEPEFTLAHGTGFAAAVLLIMVSEQTFLNAGPLLVKATEGAAGSALAGFVFNALLIARAPLQLFQAVQTSILPHLTRLRAAGETDPFRRSVKLTLIAIAGFAACVSLAMLAIGPWVMDLLFGGNFDYGRGGLVLVSIGMGLYLSAATLNQALLAHGRAPQAAMAWAGCAVTFALFLLLVEFDDRVLQVEIAFLGAAAALCALLHILLRRAWNA
jgi:O-antigen/teichoic acid export membrane protein